MTTPHHADLPIEDLRRFEIRQVVPGMDDAEGPRPGVDDLPKGLGSGFWLRMPATWPAIGRVTIGEMLAWRGVGERKVRAFLGWMDDLWGRGRLPARGADVDIDEDGLLSALKDVAGWGAARGEEDLVRTFASAASGDGDAPLNALDRLASVDLASLAGPERMASWDPIAAANTLLGSLDEREIEIARQRLLTTAKRPEATLEEIATGFGVTRERVRQIERDVENRLNAMLSEDRFRAIRKRADEIAETLGTASPIEAMPADVSPDDAHLADELLLWVAGPYRLDGDWVILREAPDIPELVTEAFNDVAEGNRADRVALALACLDLGIPEKHLDRAIAEAGFEEWDADHLVLWPSTHAGRALTLLGLVGEPLSIPEMLERLPFEVNKRGFANAVQGHEDITRVGKDLYELAEWGGQEYRGVVPGMQRLLDQEEPRHIGQLAAEMHEQWGISEVSVRMYASMYPGFVAEEGWVRRRRADEPYVPTGAVEAERDCFVIDGAWALRITVDKDVLRGSGRSIPEAFAALLGVMPFTSLALSSETGPVSFQWSGMYPSVGSLRTHAEQLALTEGDLLFLRRVDDSTMDVLAHRLTDAASPEDRLRALIGNPEPGPWPLALASAIGIGRALSVSVPHLRGRLQERGNEAVLDALNELTSAPRPVP